MIAVFQLVTIHNTIIKILTLKMTNYLVYTVI